MARVTDSELITALHWLNEALGLKAELSIWYERSISGFTIYRPAGRAARSLACCLSAKETLLWLEAATVGAQLGAAPRRVVLPGES